MDEKLLVLLKQAMDLDVPFTLLPRDTRDILAEIERLKAALEKYATTHGNNHALAQMTLYGRLLTPREIDEALKGGE